MSYIVKNLCGEGAITRPPGCKSPAYKRAGVDIDAAARFVQAIAPLARRTRRPGSGEFCPGGFGGLFDLKAAGFHESGFVRSKRGWHKAQSGD